MRVIINDSVEYYYSVVPFTPETIVTKNFNPKKGLKRGCEGAEQLLNKLVLFSE
jgi:hypothetical protein